MKNPVIEAKEICRIIRAGGISGVSRLKLGDLEVEFNHDRGESVRKQQTSLFGRKPRKSETPLEKQEMLLIGEDDERAREMEDLQLLVDDPVGFEEQVIAEHLGGLIPNGREEVESSRSQ